MRPYIEGMIIASWFHHIRLHIPQFPKNLTHFLPTRLRRNLFFKKHKFMKRYFRSSLSLSLLLASIFAVGSCQKEARDKETGQPSKEQVDVAVANTTSYLVLNNALDAMFAVALSTGDESLVSGRRFGCANVTATPGGADDQYPKNVLIDFGTGCTLRGVHGKGSISFVLSQLPFIPGTVIIPEFHDFYVNGYKIEGEYKVTTITPTQFKVDVIDGVVTDPDNLVYHVKGVQYYNQLAGATSPFVFADDAYEITGNGAVSSPLGDADIEVTTPLLKDVNCTSIVSGIITIQSVGLNGTLDFGNGVCDRKATLTVGPFRVDVTLPL